MNETACDRLVEDLMPLIGRFPHFPVTNISYNRNFVELISNLFAPEEEIAPHLKELRPEATLRIGARYLEQNNGRYDSEKLKRLALSLENQYRLLESFFHERGFSDIESDLEYLKKSDSFDDLAKKLVRISPLVYDALGNALPVNDGADPLALEPVELQARYTDTFLEHLAGIYSAISSRKGFGSIHLYTRNVINQFIPKEVVPATVLYSGEQTRIRERDLILEEIPPIYTPLRGALAGDCSMISVPYFGILKRTRVFWVIRSAAEKARPGGYLFLAEILKEDGSLRPYIITINGPTISEEDCYAIFLLVRTMYPGNDLLLSDIENLPFLVNSYRVRNAMTYLKGQDVKIELPEGWISVSRWMVNTIGYENFYNKERISDAKLVVPESMPIYNVRISSPEMNNYYPASPVQEINLINRAIVGYYFLRSRPFKKKGDFLMQKLILREEDLSNIQVLIDYYQTGSFPAEDFAILKKHFDFTLDDFSYIDMYARWESLWQIYKLHKEDPDISRAQWNNICRKNFDELRTELEDNLSRSSMDTILDYLASVPDEYIPEYWEVISPHFMINDGRNVDLYMLRRFVKHFHSYGTIEQFLQFLRERREAREAVKPEDKRWYEFLERSREFMPESENLADLIQTIFYEYPIDPEMNLDLYEITKRVEAGLSFGLTFTKDFIEEIIRIRDWDYHRDELMSLID